MQSAMSVEGAVARQPRAVAVDPPAVFAALANEGCRAILRALGEETLTAQEIGERVDVPLSTVYRHLDLLTETGLLEESVRINPHGRNQNQYRRAFGDLSVSLGGDFAVSVV